MNISCTYENLPFNSLLELNCQCKHNDTVCQSFKQSLNYNLIGFDKNQFFQHELNNISFDIKIVVSEGDQIFSQSILLSEINETPQLFIIIIIALMIIFLILVIVLCIHISLKCKQKKINTKLVQEKVAVEQTPCSSIIICTNFENEEVINTIV
ncbi:Hypothetical_protein [Hexamita inflata]|uniref:Hypothetical_protein n=1 Tax=Hexamita inflata TaxID=28002 RepID=A0ABP1HVU3_9EUKA